MSPPNTYTHIYILFFNRREKGSKEKEKHIPCSTRVKQATHKRTFSNYGTPSLVGFDLELLCCQMLVACSQRSLLSFRFQRQCSLEVGVSSLPAGQPVVEMLMVPSYSLLSYPRVASQKSLGGISLPSPLKSYQIKSLHKVPTPDCFPAQMLTDRSHRDVFC